MREYTVTFPQCIASNALFYTGGHVGHNWQNLSQNSRLWQLQITKVCFITNDPHDNMYKIYHWKQCIVGRLWYLLKFTTTSRNYAAMILMYLAFQTKSIMGRKLVDYLRLFCVSRIQSVFSIQHNLHFVLYITLVLSYSAIMKQTNTNNRSQRS